MPTTTLTKSQTYVDHLCSLLPDKKPVINNNSKCEQTLEQSRRKNRFKIRSKITRIKQPNEFSILCGTDQCGSIPITRITNQPWHLQEYTGIGNISITQAMLQSIIYLL